MRHRRINGAIRTSLIYGAIAAVWILVSDQVLDAIVGTPRGVGLQTYKGWAFVVITTVLFYAVLRRELRRWEQEIAARAQAETALRESQARLAGIVESAMDAIISVDATQRVVVFNAAAEQMFGCTAAAALGQPLDRFIPPQLRAPHAAHIQAFGHTGATTRSMHAPGQLVALRADGAEFPIEATISQVIAQGQPLYTVIMRDITTRRHAEQALQRSAERLRVLADASNAFAKTGAAYAALLDQIVKTVTTVLSAGCVLNLRSDDGRWMHTVAFDDVDPAARDLQRELLDAEPVLLDDHWLSTLDDHTLPSLLVPVVDMAALRGNAPPAYLALVERIGVHSLIRIPLRVHGQVIGVLVLHRHRREQPAFDDDDLRLAQDLADRAALALGTARLYVALEQSHATLETRVAERTAELATSNATLAAEMAERARLGQELQRQARQASALAALSHALAEAGRELQPLFDTVVRQVTELMSDTCVLSVVSTDRQWMHPVASRDPDPERDRALRTLLAVAPERATAGWSGAVLTSGQALLIGAIPSDEARAQIDPRYHPLLATLDALGVLVVPVRAHDTVLGTLTVIRARPGETLTVDDQAFLQDLADRAGLAIENARLFESEQAARSAADRANQAKSAFLASMTHELRTPLNAILGFTGTLLMKLPGPLTPDQEKQLVTVKRSAQHLLALINDVLDLARIESGKVSIARETVVCQDIVATVAASLRPLADEKQLRFRVDMPAEPVTLTSDARALTQILTNLVGNAIKFTDAGEVVIRMSRAASDVGLGDDPTAHRGAHTQSLIISVYDTGIGITPADQARLFQEFGRVDSAEVRAREGTGLGLRLAHQLAALLGGHIAVASEYHVGSTFTLILPDI